MISMVANLEQLIELLTRALIHFVWQGALAAVVLGAVLWLARRATPWTRYRIACWGLLLMVCLPAATLWWMANPATSGSHTAVAEGVVPESSASETEFFPGPTLAVAKLLGEDRAPSSVLTSLRWTLFTIWLIGVAALSLSHTVAWVRLRRLTWRGVLPAPEIWQRRVDRLSQRLGLCRVVQILQSALVEVPTVVGWFRPVVLVPIGSLTGLDPRQMEAVLAHELAHIWRRDYLVNLLQVVAETLLFYHPAVWWASRRIREEREHCCDDAAVALTGDRLALAKALLQLEELRTSPPRLVPALSGGSLVQRISRLLGGEVMSRHRTRHPLLNAALIATILAVVGVAWAAVATNPTNASLVPATSDPVYSPAVGGSGESDVAGDLTGTWTAEPEYGKIHLRLKTGTKRNRSNLGFDVEASELITRTAGSFQLSRDPGTISFQGSLVSGAGNGTFSFEPNRAFVRDLERYGVDDFDNRELLALATTQVDREYVAELDRLGFGDQLEGDILIALGIHRVTTSYISELASRGYEETDLDNLLAMRIHGVNAEWIDGVQALGYELDADELLAWRIHGVNEEWAEAVRHEGYDLDGENLLAWRIHGVSGEFIESLRDAGFDDLDGDEVLAMRIHGVSPEWMREMRDVGIEEFDADTAIAFRVHGVSPEFVREFEDLGYANIDGDHLVAMRVHGVRADFVEELSGLGYSNVDLDDLVAMRIHGVDADFIEKQHDRHGSRISIEDLIENKILGRY